MAAFPQVSKFRGKALDFLFPRWCVGCGREGELICAACRSSLAYIQPPICPRCGVPQPRAQECPACAQKHLSSIDGIRSPFSFEGVMRQAVHQLKYRNLRILAAPLACLLAGFLAQSQLPADVLVPVPLHSSRLRERGYNQSELLARELGRLSGIMVQSNCLLRPRPTPPQVRTAALKERQRNVRGAFTCTGRLDGRRVLLIDDVATSGATLDACAAALKAAGAASVWGLTLAREV